MTEPATGSLVAYESEADMLIVRGGLRYFVGQVGAGELNDIACFRGGVTTGAEVSYFLGGQ
jgi:hypothetical protein